MSEELITLELADAETRLVYAFGLSIEERDDAITEIKREIRQIRRELEKTREKRMYSAIKQDREEKCQENKV